MPPTLDERVRDLEEERRLLRLTLEGINRDLRDGRERMKEAEVEVDALGETVEEMRRQLPLLQLTSDWVRAGVVGVFALVGVAIVGLVLR